MPIVIAAPHLADTAPYLAELPTSVWERPERQQIREDLRGADASGVVVLGGLDLLHRVVEGLHRLGRLGDVPITFVGGPDASGLLRHVLDGTGVPVGPWAEVAAAEPIPVELARNDIGGILLCEAEFALPRLKKFGMQAYHDDALIADGWIRSLVVRPSYGERQTLRASVTPRWRGGIKSTLGRAVQAASDDVPMTVDGVDYGTVSGRTWYLDDSVHWRLRGIVVEPRIPADRHR